MILINDTRRCRRHVCPGIRFGGSVPADRTVPPETGVVMLIYLDAALRELQAERERAGKPFTREDLYAAIMTGAVERVRPKMIAAIMAGLLRSCGAMAPSPR